MGVTGFDTTPRRGRNGVCVCQATPQLFEVMMEGLFKKCIEENREFLFIDAWNEWGESMYLEPDSKYGLAYLEVLLKISFLNAPTYLSIVYFMDICSFSN